MRRSESAAQTWAPLPEACVPTALTALATLTALAALAALPTAAPHALRVHPCAARRGPIGRARDTQHRGAPDTRARTFGAGPRMMHGRTQQPPRHAHAPPQDVSLADLRCTPCWRRSPVHRSAGTLSLLAHGTSFHNYPLVNDHLTRGLLHRLYWHTQVRDPCSSLAQRPHGWKLCAPPQAHAVHRSVPTRPRCPLSRPPSPPAEESVHPLPARPPPPARGCHSCHHSCSPTCSIRALTHVSRRRCMSSSCLPRGS